MGSILGGAGGGGLGGLLDPLGIFGGKGLLGGGGNGGGPPDPLGLFKGQQQQPPPMMPPGSPMGQASQPIQTGGVAGVPTDNAAMPPGRR